MASSSVTVVTNANRTHLDIEVCIFLTPSGNSQLANQVVGMLVEVLLWAEGSGGINAHLGLLASKAGRTVSKEEILETVWPKTVVTEDSIIRCVSQLRKAFGAPELIEAITKRDTA